MLRMKTITFNADEKLIEAAQAKANAEKTTLNELFRQWLNAYVDREQQANRAIKTIETLQSKYSTKGQHYTRETMNERR